MLAGTVRLVVLLALLATTSGGAALAQSGESRVALVVGNGAYQHTDPLRNPVNDARAVAAALTRFGFDVVLRENATRRAMIDGLNAFEDKLAPGGVGLFFYAGHGIQARGINYLLPVDAMISNEKDLKYETLEVQDPLGRMEDGRVRLSLVILDACRDNPFARSLRSVATHGLAEIKASRGTLIAYATGPGQTAADGDGENGLYTAELLKTIGQPGLKLEEVFKLAADGVERRSGTKQTPWMSSSVRGEFYFVPSAGPGAMPPVSGMASPAALLSFAEQQQEQLAFMAVLNATTAGPYEAFLASFPNSRLVGVARAKAEALGKSQPEPARLAGTYTVSYPAQPGMVSIAEIVNATGGILLVRGINENWIGRGRIGERGGYYNWLDGGGNTGHSTFEIDADGTLQGRVKGLGFDLQFIARRTDGAK